MFGINLLEVVFFASWAVSVIAVTVAYHRYNATANAS